MSDPTARAQHLVELGRHAEALDLLRLALADSPDDAYALTLTAVAHLGLEQHAQALAAADGLTALRPDQPDGHRLRSQALSGLRRRHEAVTAAAEAVRLEPQDWAGHAQLALTAVHLPRHGSEALAAARHAVALAPSEPDTHFAVGYVAGRLARPEESEAAYRRALALDPRHTAALNNLTATGLGAWQLGRRARGFVEVLREDPSEPVARENLGRVVVAALVEVHLAALAALLVTTAVAASGAAAAPRAVTALVTLGCVAGAAVLVARRLPTGVVLLARTQVTRSPFLLVLVALLGVTVIATLWAGFAPFEAWFPRRVLRPLGLLDVLLLVWSVLRARVDG